MKVIFTMESAELHKLKPHFRLSSAHKGKLFWVLTVILYFQAFCTQRKVAALTHICTLHYLCEKILIFKKCFATKNAEITAVSLQTLK